MSLRANCVQTWVKIGRTVFLAITKAMYTCYDSLEDILVLAFYYMGRQALKLTGIVSCQTDGCSVINHLPL